MKRWFDDLPDWARGCIIGFFLVCLTFAVAALGAYVQTNFFSR